MQIDLRTVLQKSIETLVDFVTNQIDTSKTQVLFRTYALVHCKGSTWEFGRQVFNRFIVISSVDGYLHKYCIFLYEATCGTQIVKWNGG